MDTNGSHFWNQRKKRDSITYIFEKSSEKIFKMQSGVKVIICIENVSYEAAYYTTTYSIQ
jgi:hypothetical protein